MRFPSMFNIRAEPLTYGIQVLCVVFFFFKNLSLQPATLHVSLQMKNDRVKEKH